MCGITGIVSIDGSPIKSGAIEEMTQEIFHRGPDFGQSVLMDQCHLGHRRLSIIDLKPESNQPFSSKDGRYQMVYNGEIYNYKSIKKQLQDRGITFRTSSDTEVLLEAFLLDGESIIPSLNGIFAFAIWDKEEKKLTVARDHIGVKPFYYQIEDGKFYFSSEIKAISKVLPAQLNQDRVPEYLQFGAVAGEETLFKGVKRLLPGSILTIHLGVVSIREYFNSITTNFLSESKETAESLLNDSINMQMVSDVPVGTMCSGGLDSSYIAVESASLSDIQLNAYTVKIPFKGYDESVFAKEVTKHAGLKYNELEFNPQRASELLPTLIWLHDEPLRHPNSIPIFEISRLAKEDVTVLLSGEGADEIFGGYSTYLRMPKTTKVSKLPMFLRRLMLKKTRSTGSGKQVILSSLAKTTAQKMLNLRANDEPQTIEKICVNGKLNSAYRDELASKAIARSNGDDQNALMYIDQYTHLQTLLDRQDKMCMGCSIESRVPFLDHRLISFLNHQKSEVKMPNGQTKQILRNIGKKVLPEVIFNRPKYPFGLPLFDQYLGDKKYKAQLEALPVESPLVKYKILNGAEIQKVIDSFAKGERYHEDLIWNILNLDLWYKIFITKEIVPDRNQLPAYKVIA